MLPDIEWHAHLRADAVLNASNLGNETTPAHVRHGRSFARRTADILGLPLAATIVPLVALGDEASTTRAQLPTIAGPSVTEALTDGQPDPEPLVVMPRFVRTPWDN